MKIITFKEFGKILVLIIVVSAPLFFIQKCEKNDFPKNDLVIKDSLIYKKGSNTPFTGREKARVENKIIEYEIVDGVKHGEFFLYYEDGTPQIKGTLDNNRNVGKWQYFYQNGELESEGFFVDDKPEGRWVWFYPNGKLKEEGSYHNGQRVGWWKQFDENGNVIFENEFEITDSLASEDSMYLDLKKFQF